MDQVDQTDPDINQKQDGEVFFFFIQTGELPEFLATLLFFSDMVMFSTSSPFGPGSPWFPGSPRSPFSPMSPGGPIKPINPPWPCRIIRVEAKNHTERVQ